MSLEQLTSSDGGVTWNIVAIDRRGDGRLEVVYSFAPAVHYRIIVVPGTDAARAVRLTGDALAETYQQQGYL